MYINKLIDADIFCEIVQQYLLYLLWLYMVVISKIIEWIKLCQIAVCKNQCFMSWDGFILWNQKEVGLKPLIHKKFYSVLLFTT